MILSKAYLFHTEKVQYENCIKWFRCVSKQSLPSFINSASSPGSSWAVIIGLHFMKNITIYSTSALKHNYSKPILPKPKHGEKSKAGGKKKTD